jgi:hypothetical protein
MTLSFNRLKEIDISVGIEPETIRQLERAQTASAPDHAAPAAEHLHGRAARAWASGWASSSAWSTSTIRSATRKRWRATWACASSA